MNRFRELNIERLKVLSEEVRKVTESLYEYTRLSEEDILSNKTVLNAIKYNFVVAIQAVIDICHHIVARLAGKVPDEYGECFLILQEMGYINQDYAIKLKSMAGFRNILVHLYHEVDDKRVVRYLKEDISVVEDFLKVVKRLVESK